MKVSIKKASDKNVTDANKLPDAPTSGGFLATPGNGSRFKKPRGKKIYAFL